VYILQRQSRKESLIAAFNLSGKIQTAKISESNLPVTVLLDTDWETFGGRTPRGKTVCTRSNGGLSAALPPFSGLLLSCDLSACQPNNPDL
jgi:hypothetical protein